MADADLAGARFPSTSGLRSSGGETFLVAAIAAYLAILTVWPLVQLIYESLLPGGEGEVLGLLIGQWGSAAAQTALIHTIEASVLATLVAVAIGIALAAAITLTDVRGKSALAFLALLPLLVPSQITALAWIALTDASSPILEPLGLAPPPGAENPLYSRWGVVLVMGIEHSGLVFLAVRAALRSLPRDLIEAARLGGAHPLRVTRSVIVPLVWPAFLAGAALAFVAGIGNFGVPALLGIPGRYSMLTTLIYQRLEEFGVRALGEMAALTVVLAALAAIGLVARALLLHRRQAAIEGSTAPLEPFRLGRGRGVVAALIWIVLLAIVVLPLLALVAVSLAPALGVPLRFDTMTLASYQFAFAQHDATIRAIGNSFILALVTAVVSVLVAVPLAYLAALRGNRLGRAINALVDAFGAAPGTVLAVAIMLVLLPPLPFTQVSLYGTIWIILVVYLVHFLALAVRPTIAGMQRVNRNLDEAAQIAGASVFTRLRAVITPVVAPATAAGALLIFIIAFNELTISALLSTTGSETLGVVILTLHYEGQSPAAAAVATASIAVTLALAGITSALLRSLPEEVLPWRA